MTSIDYFAHGSKWVRTDFHMHTQADKEFVYKGIDFIGEYVAALEASDVRIAVIENWMKMIFH